MKGGEKIGWLAMLCAVKSSNVAGIEALLKKGLPAVWPEKFNSFLDIYFSPEGANTLVPEVVEVSCSYSYILDLRLPVCQFDRCRNWWKMDATP